MNKFISKSQPTLSREKLQAFTHQSYYDICCSNVYGDSTEYTAEDIMHLKLEASDKIYVLVKDWYLTKHQAIEFAITRCQSKIFNICKRFFALGYNGDIPVLLLEQIVESYRTKKDNQVIDIYSQYQSCLQSDEDLYRGNEECIEALDDLYGALVLDDWMQDDDEYSLAWCIASITVENGEHIDDNDADIMFEELQKVKSCF